MQMLKRTAWITLFILMAIPLLFNYVYARNDQRLFSVGIRTGFHQWGITTERYSYSSKLGYHSHQSGSPEDREEARMLGPEITFCNKDVYFRAFYMRGESDFTDRGMASRQYMGFDIGPIDPNATKKGMVTVYFGLRHARLQFSEWEDDQLSDQNMTGVTMGVYAGTNQRRRGFHAALEGAFSIRLLPYSLVQVSTFGNWNPKFLEWANHNLFMDVQVNMGYAFRPIPLEMKLGFEIFSFGKPIEKFENDSVVRLDSIAIGALFELAYRL
jgi:hypothetical protein